jgi:hypothetical protein
MAGIADNVFGEWRPYVAIASGNQILSFALPDH